MLERWKQYFEELLNINVMRQEDIYPRLQQGKDEQETMEPLSIEEVRKAIRKPKNNKTPGIDNILGELIKYGKNQIAIALHELINRI